MVLGVIYIELRNFGIFHGQFDYREYARLRVTKLTIFLNQNNNNVFLTQELNPRPSKYQ